ncbi:unnamed protein product [Soboliphyme baturini]|uniref:Uncharacterized protein n=1 Tax=Soboliphyme baturini TaxID=241478 RepID=A0A183JAI2_9BILA|nr:unnamed protein product [Soboliphyme baturini]
MTEIVGRKTSPRKKEIDIAKSQCCSLASQSATGVIAACDSDSLLPPSERNPSPDPQEPQVTSLPEKWPGVGNLVTLLSVSQNEDMPNLLMMLVEGWGAIYLSLFAYAFTSYDSRWLYRLMAHPVNDEMFSAVFGGGAEKKTLLEYATMAMTLPEGCDSVATSRSVGNSGHYHGNVSLENSDPAKLRAKFHAKVFGLQPDTLLSSPSGGSADAPHRSRLVSTRTEWLSPKKSVMAYYMTKVCLRLYGH